MEPSTNATSIALNDTEAISVKHASPVVAFIIGLSIIVLASLLNACGLNLTKLDHVRTSGIPKAERKPDWKRPLWLLGMLLYITSQLLGSTLALEYMRAEYVAPLGSMSLVFNFLFARFLVGTPVTSNDVYGTIVVALGVIGIVLFGSINSGLASDTDVAHLTYLWRRGGWLGFFFAMSFALIALLLCTDTLNAILSARGDLSASAEVPGALDASAGFIAKARHGWNRSMHRLAEVLDNWTSSKDDKTVAWTLGIGWACCGGGLAGGTLVFAKAVVKLLSGSLSHENEGNQFGHAAPIFTIIFLVCTAVLQIICLNRGLKVYDSTLVVPVFYGVYTATGFLNSLIFNDEVDAYESWTLFLIFVSILVLITGVVLLTHKKPEPGVTIRTPPGSAGIDIHLNKSRSHLGSTDNDEEVGGASWQVGEDSDDEDGHRPTSPRPRLQPQPRGRGDEAVGLMDERDD